MTDRIITHPDYRQIHNICVTDITYSIEAMDPRPDFVLGVSRGGLIPAVMLSHSLHTKLVPVDYSSKEGKGDDRDHSNTLPTIEPEASTLLLIDDICDSGKTLAELVSHYEGLGHRVVSAVLYYKERDDGPHIPNVYWQKIPSDGPWIIFPWETSM